MARYPRGALAGQNQIRWAWRSVPHNVGDALLRREERARHRRLVAAEQLQGVFEHQVRHG